MFFFNPFVVFHYFSKHSFRNTIRVSNSLEPDQARRSVGPDLVPNCLQKLSADDTRRYGVNILTAASVGPDLVPNCLQKLSADDTRRY